MDKKNTNNATTRNVVPNRNYKYFLSFLNGKENIDEITIRNSEEQCAYELAKLIMSSQKYVEDYKKNGGKYIHERLRDGYIGMVVTTTNGASFIQNRRGKPFGSVVSIPLDNNEIAIGVSYINESENEKAIPIIGLAMALKRAIEMKEANKNGINPIPSIRHYSRPQIEHFSKRSKAYFFPEKYSVSRGTNPVKYENYDEIHQRRKMILGEEKSFSEKVN